MQAIQARRDARKRTMRNGGAGVGVGVAGVGGGEEDGLFDQHNTTNGAGGTAKNVSPRVAAWSGPGLEEGETNNTGYGLQIWVSTMCQAYFQPCVCRRLEIG